METEKHLENFKKWPQVPLESIITKILKHAYIDEFSIKFRFQDKSIFRKPKMAFKTWKWPQVLLESQMSANN